MAQEWRGVWASTSQAYRAEVPIGASRPGIRSGRESRCGSDWLCPMGSWGPAVFSNDTSSDVREEFVVLIGDGLTAEDATAQLQASHGVRPPPDADPDLSVDFWLALALTQHRLGRLLPWVSDAARAAVADPRELERWDRVTRKRRETALVRAVAKLAEPMPPPRKVKKRVRCETVLEPGQHLIYTLDSGARVMLRVVGVMADDGGRYPQVAVLDWHGSQPVPRNPGALRVCPSVVHNSAVGKSSMNRGMGFTLTGNPGDPLDRIEFVPSPDKSRFGFRRSSQPFEVPAAISRWGSTWDGLDRWFDPEGAPRSPF